MLLSAFSLIGQSCNTNSNSLEKLKLSYPHYFPKPIATPIRNETTAAGVALGEQLFFDSQLSANNQISCASCHIPKLAFSDGLQFSTGHSGSALKRNTPALINLAWSKQFFWDGGVKNLESLSFAALMSPDEMGIDLASLVNTLNQNNDYKSKFRMAFGVDSIASAYIGRALAQYLRTLISSESKYDSVRLGFYELSTIEKKGQTVFNNNCASCHSPPLFTNHGFHHNGLNHVYSSENLFLNTGRFRITRDSSDLGKYRTPTLRDLKYSAPYMHDGRFKTIDEVLDHYQNINTLNQFQDTLVNQILFNDDERHWLKAFLKTLNKSYLDQNRK